MTKKQKTPIRQFRNQKTWEHYLADAQLNTLKPFIRAEALAIGREILTQVSTLTLQNLAEVRLRGLALEAILIEKGIVTEEEIKDRMITEEDKLTGHETVDVVEEGDLVRLDIETISKALPLDATEEEKQAAAAVKYYNGNLLVLNANKARDNGQVQTVKELEASLIGLKAGDKKTVTTDDDFAMYEYTIRRVSRAIKKEDSKND